MITLPLQPGNSGQAGSGQSTKYQDPLSISFTAFPKRHHLPMVPQPSQTLWLAGDHMLNHRSLGDISIWTTPQLSVICVIYLFALGADASSAGRNCFRESVSERKIRNRTLSHPVCTVDRPPSPLPYFIIFLMCTFIQCLHRENSFISCWLFNISVFK